MYPKNTKKLLKIKNNKMKQIITLLAIVLLISCKKDSEQKDETTTNDNISAQWNNFSLNGKVKSTQEYTTEVNRDEQSGPRKFINPFNADYTLTFNEKGKLIRKDVYREDGTIAEEITYDGKDKILNIKKNISPTQSTNVKYTWEGNNNTIITTRHADGSLLNKEVFQFEKGLKIKKLKFNNKEIQTDRTEYAYDDQNRLSEEIYFKDKPTIQGRLTIEYDVNGNKSAESYMDKDYKQLWKTSFQYQGTNLTTAITYSAAGEVEFELNNVYDENNRLISKATREPFNNNFSTKEVFNYDVNNNTSSWQVYENGELKNTTLYLYDEKNNLISETLYDKFKNPLYTKTIEYTYDDFSNWIKKTVTIDNDKKYITSRKIEYFK
jgi:hypothetical protein